MIECACCERWFHPDEIRECHKCGEEICEECFNKHLIGCGEFDGIDEEYDHKLDIPKECPNCTEELELDFDYESTTLLCSKCVFKLDVTDKFKEIGNK